MKDYIKSALVCVLCVCAASCAPTNSDPAQTRAAKQTLEQKETFVLDVRTGMEFSSGHLENAVNIPVSALEERLDELPRANRTSRPC